MRQPFYDATYPRWRDPHGVVHMVGLHTRTSIRTECGVFIVRSGSLQHQIEQFDPCADPPNCIECAAEWEPF